MTTSTGITITSPLVLYRSLVAINRIRPDQAQYRLALHLQKLYERLKDYEPSQAYSDKLKGISNALRSEENPPATAPKPPPRSPALWKALIAEKEHRESLALTRTLTDQKAALNLDSPKGLLVHGEVGTGKSMLIDLFAESLPTKQKRRWHYNTFMLETISKLEFFRRERLNASPGIAVEEHSLLWLARDLISTSPILFIDEFQLPDRFASKTLSNLFTSFFQLGGVLVATSNRMPDELAKASGMEYMNPPSTMDSIRWRLGFGGKQRQRSSAFAGQGEFAEFLELLKARCEVFEMTGETDYRKAGAMSSTKVTDKGVGSAPPPAGIVATGDLPQEKQGSNLDLPKFYCLDQPEHDIREDLITALRLPGNAMESQPWERQILQVYGHKIVINRAYNGAVVFDFNDICVARLGPADYVTIASTYSTLAILNIPILMSSLKNEARRFITLLDALYESKCRLFIHAAAGPDDLFFPDLRPRPGSTGAGDMGVQHGKESKETEDAIHSETFSEVHQDLTSPFRPNISSYDSGSGSSEVLAHDALEDDPPNKMRRNALGDMSEHERMEMLGQLPNFSQASSFVGEDERFAYKRAASRMWEMCSDSWWSRSGMWKPLPKESRRWESSAEESSVPKKINEENVFRNGASPFRRHPDPPPKDSGCSCLGDDSLGAEGGSLGPRSRRVTG